MPTDVKMHAETNKYAAGFLELQRARVRWFLSINYDIIPKHIKEMGQRTYRSIILDGQEIEFSEGFTDLHTKSYKAILEGNGFGLLEAKTSIDIVHAIRNSKPFVQMASYN